MKIKIHYGDGVLALPGAVLELLPRAEESAVKILICLAAGGNTSKEKLAEMAGCNNAEVDQALAFWRGAGILDQELSEKDRKKVSVPAEKKVSPPPATKETMPIVEVVDSSVVTDGKKLPLPAPTLPRYTTEELTALLESRKELSDLIHECNNVFGKILNAHEVNQLLSLIDYLNLDSEYLLLLLAHCVKIGKKSIHYVENYAVTLYDEGVTDVKSLEERLKMREEMEAIEGKIRTLFGMKSRALTAKERKMIETWIHTYKYDMEIITRAYEMTVNAIGNASVPYTNSILERWAASGLHTLADIDRSEAERGAHGQSKATPGNSFDTNDFFNAALKRSFGDDYQPQRKDDKK